MLVIILFALFPPSYYQGLPNDASYAALSYALSTVCEYPNFENPAGLKLLREGGFSISYGYSSRNFLDILNYGQQMKLKNLTSVSIFSEGGGFSYRPVLRKNVNYSTKAEDILIDEFHLALADLLLRRLYGGISLKYIHVRYGIASIEDDYPIADIGTYHGFSVGFGLILDCRPIAGGVFCQNLFSRVYYKRYPDDILRRYGGLGVKISPIKGFDTHADIIFTVGEKLSYIFSAYFKPYKGLSLAGSFSMPDKNFGLGLGTEYKYGSLFIGYRRSAIFITLRSNLNE
ncbi:MAG: hypothetical protein ABIM20_01210 [candidate division WOR-3 bacterium]